MEKFYFEIPGISRKEDAIDYIREFLEYGSEINGKSWIWIIYRFPTRRGYRAGRISWCGKAIPGLSG